MKNNELIEYKKLLLAKIINFQSNKNTFDYYDGLLTEKRFNLVTETSIIENYVYLCYLNINKEVFNEIIDNFIKNSHSTHFFEKPYIKELIKATSNKMLPIEKKITDGKILILADKIKNVSCETKSIYHDFLLLKLSDNILVKTNNPIIKNKYKNLRKSLFKQLIGKNYEKENKEKYKYCYCYTDRLINACVTHEISLNDFITIESKILKLTDNNLKICWKIVMAINYLSFNNLFDDSAELRKFKRDILRRIKNSLDVDKYTKNDVLNVVLMVLAAEFYKKENFYYLFDILEHKLFDESDDVLFYFDLLEYIVYFHFKRSIFHLRFVRQAFFALLNKLSVKKNNCIELERILKIYIVLFNIDIFYYFKKKELLDKIFYLLKILNKDKKNISRQCFYKYCDVADYISFYNKDIVDFNKIKDIADNTDEQNKILQKFKLCKSIVNF